MESARVEEASQLAAKAAEGSVAVATPGAHSGSRERQGPRPEARGGASASCMRARLCTQEEGEGKKAWPGKGTDEISTGG